jgi:hypothetical protein
MKASITINDKKYNVPLSYKDITLKRFKEIQKFINSDKIVTPSILGEVEQQPTEQQTINYYVKFINVVTDIPIDTLMQVNLHTIDDNVGIKDLFHSFTWLYFMPKETTDPIKKIGKYHFFDVSGVMKDNSLIEYTEASTLIAALNNLKEANLDYLNLLLGIFYRPKVGWFKRTLEPYNSDRVQERAKEFDNLTMDIVWNAMFFFIQSKRSSLKNIEASLEAKVKELQTGHSKRTTGLYLSATLLKVVFLTKVIKHRMKLLISRMFIMF